MSLGCLENSRMWVCRMGGDSGPRLYIEDQYEELLIHPEYVVVGEL